MDITAVIGSAAPFAMDMLGAHRFLMFRGASQAPDWQAQFDAIVAAVRTDPYARVAIQCERAEQAQYLLDLGAGEFDVGEDDGHVGERVDAWLREVGYVRDSDQVAEQRKVRELFEDLEASVDGLSGVLFERIASRNLDKRLDDLHAALGAVRRSARHVMGAPV